MFRPFPDGAEMVELEGNPRPGVIEPERLYHFYALVYNGKILSVKAKSGPIDLSSGSAKTNWGYLKSEQRAEDYLKKFRAAYGDPENLLIKPVDWSELELA